MADPRPPRLAELINRLQGALYLKAAAHARAQVTPLYRGDELPTPTEKGMLRNVAAVYQDGYLAALDDLAAALAGGPAPLPQHMGWQPIDTAPKDGTRILVWYPQIGRVHTASRRDDVLFYGPGGAEPTHWMPLPDPPLNVGVGEAPPAQEPT